MVSCLSILVNAICVCVCSLVLAIHVFFFFSTRRSPASSNIQEVASFLTFCCREIPLRNSDIFLLLEIILQTEYYFQGLLAMGVVKNLKQRRWIHTITCYKNQTAERIVEEQLLSPSWACGWSRLDVISNVLGGSEGVENRYKTNQRGIPIVKM